MQVNCDLNHKLLNKKLLRQTNKLLDFKSGTYFGTKGVLTF